MADRKPTFTDTDRKAALKARPEIQRIENEDGSFSLLNLPGDLPAKEMRQTFERFAAQRSRAEDRNSGKDADKAATYKAQKVSLLAISCLFRPEIVDAVVKAAAAATKRQAAKAAKAAIQPSA